MATLATGVFKKLVRKAESSYGVAAGTSGGQYVRRVTSTLDLSKDPIESQEIREDQQDADFRHGVRRVSGTISGELSPGTYALEIAAALRRAFTAGVSITGASITIAAGTAPTYTLTRAAGSWLTDGVKKGDVGRLTAGSFTASNLNKNLQVIGVTALVLTVLVVNRSGLVAEGPIASATFAVTGKKTYAPTSGHTTDSFNYEHWHADTSMSELFLGCRVNQVAFKLPPTGMAMVDIGITGQDITTAGAAYFSAPSAATTTGLLQAVNGAVVSNGVLIATITGLDLTLTSALSGDPVVGSNTIPNQFPGRIRLSGQATAYFGDATFRDAFVNETEIDLMVVLTADNSAAADFMTLVIPRLKVNGSGKNDGEGAIVQTIPIKALINLAGGTGTATERTTLVVQDSAAP